MVPVRYRIMLLVLLLESVAQTIIFRRALRWASTREHTHLIQVTLWIAVFGMVVGSLSDFEFLGGVFDWFPGSVIGTVRTATALWAFSSTVALALYGAIALPVQTVSRSFCPERRTLVRAVAGATVSAPFFATSAGVLLERTRIEVTECRLALVGLPKEFEGFRLLQLSDIHLSPYLREATLARVVDMSNGLHPDLAVVTGDLISSKGDPLDACLRQLSRLRAPAGILGCLGNHEIYSNAEDYATRAGAKLGVQFLRGTSRTIASGNGRLHVAGVDYEPFERRAHYLQGQEKLVVPGGVNLLLSHNPDVFPAAANMGFDLVLAGHTHGGQVTAEILQQTLNPARMITPFVRGFYHQGNRHCYVNRGIGTLGIPARLACPPEITLIRLVCA
jgi:predicted MPP superfamily phosphohydrolase